MRQQKSKSAPPAGITQAIHGVIAIGIAVALQFVFAPDIPLAVAAGVATAVGLLTWNASASYQRALARKRQINDKIKAGSISGAAINEELSHHAVTATVSASQRQVDEALRTLDLKGPAERLTEKDVHRAYKRAMHKVHPDKNQSKDTAHYTHLSILMDQARKILLNHLPKT